jgi:hypothetical protein
MKIVLTGKEKWAGLGVIPLTLSGIFITLSLLAILCTPIAGRWGSPRAMFWALGALGLWLVWISHLCWMLFRRSSARNGWKIKWAKIFGAALASLIALSVAGRCGGALGKALCFREVRTAVAAGLQADCGTLLLHWPPAKGGRIYDSDPEFAKLPASLKMLTPVYITNDLMEDTNLPPHVGLCKNGWFGIGRGILVFRSDQDADQFMAGLARARETGRDLQWERIAPGIYVWWLFDDGY